MSPKNDYVTKKDLEVFGEKLKKEIDVSLDKKLEEKLEQKLEEKFDVKFAEYFEIIMNSLNKTIYSALGLHKAETDKSLDKIFYDVSVHDQQFVDHKYRIEKLEKKVFVSEI